MQHFARFLLHLWCRPLGDVNYCTAQTLLTCKPSGFSTRCSDSAKWRLRTCTEGSESLIVSGSLLRTMGSRTVCVFMRKARTVWPSTSAGFHSVSVHSSCVQTESVVGEEEKVPSHSYFLFVQCIYECLKDIFYTSFISIYPWNKIHIHHTYTCVDSCINQHMKSY